MSTLEATPARRDRLRCWVPGWERLEERALLAVPPAGLTPPPVAAASLGLVRTPPVHQIAHVANSATTIRGVVYTTRGGEAEALDVSVPKGPAPAGGWPVVLAVHGGGWRKLDRSGYAAKVAGTLAQAGFAVVAPDYSLSAPGRPSWPLALDDLRDAVRWVRSTGATLGLNPRHLAAMGESAGGHLAALLGTEPSPATRVDAVVDFFGPADLTAMVANHTLGAGAVLQFLGARPEQDPVDYAAASPARRVTRASAPILIFQGTADPFVPPSQSQALADAYAAAGASCQLTVLAGLGHGFGLRAGGLDLRPSLLAFLHASLGV